MVDWVVKLGHTIKIWLCYYFAFCKAALFIVGLIFSHSIVEYAVVVVFMTYLMTEWKEDLQKSASTVNINQGLTSIITLASAHIANTYIGGFKMILLSTTAYITGLIMLCLSDLQLLPHTKVCLFYIAVTMIDVGKGGRNSTLKTFLTDQFRAEYQDHDGCRVESRRQIWWRLAWFMGMGMGMVMVMTSSALPCVHWPQSFELSAFVLVAGFVMFLFGIPFYHCPTPTPSGIERSPIVVIYRVFKVALVNRYIHYPVNTDQFYGTNHSLSLPQTSHFRWLNRAAIIEGSCVLSPEEEERKGRLCTVTQVEETKLLIGMVPMWMTFLVYSLVKSTGENFFTMQGLSMNGNGKDIIVLCMIKYLLSHTISSLWESVLSKKFNETHKSTVLLARIGIGMLSSLCCCTIAWRVEAHRLSLVQRFGVTKTPKPKVTMTITWLVPQYCLLGLMEGLAEDGLKEFFYLQLCDRMEGYGPLLNHFALGIGNLLSALSIYASRRWFSDHLNQSHLDKYYQMLAVLSYLNLGCYLYVSNMYASKKSTERQVQLEVITRTGVTDAASSIQLC